MKKDKPSKSINQQSKSKSLISLLKGGGYILPTTDDDLEEYDQLYTKTDIILPPEVDSPNFLFVNDQKKDKIDEKNELHKLEIMKAILPLGDKITLGKAESLNNGPQKNYYFKKLVLAAEIANELHSEPTFGHKKFVKVYYICEQVCKIKLSTNYGEYAAGPLDPKHMYSVDAQFKNRKWFVVKKRENGYGYNYLPGENIDQYKQYYPRYFSKQLDSISRIIDLFRKKDSNFCEIVATLFFIWDRELSKGRVVDDTLLFKCFYEWGEEKQKFRIEKLNEALEWMRNEQIVPLST